MENSELRTVLEERQKELLERAFDSDLNLCPLLELIIKDFDASYLSKCLTVIYFDYLSSLLHGDLSMINAVHRDQFYVLRHLIDAFNGVTDMESYHSGGSYSLL